MMPPNMPQPNDIVAIIAILSVFGGPVLIVLVVCLFRYRAACMKHKQILAAIEKGVPLPELSEPRIPSWISNTAGGIAFIAFSSFFIFPAIKHSGGLDLTMASPTIIFLSIGLFFLIRGLLLRKHVRQIDRPQ